MRVVSENDQPVIKYSVCDKIMFVVVLSMFFFCFCVYITFWPLLINYITLLESFQFCSNKKKELVPYAAWAQTSHSNETRLAPSMSENVRI